MRKAAFFFILMLSLLVTFPALCESTGSDTLTISFVGDCSVGDAYRYRDYQLSFAKTLAKKGLDWPFSLVLPILEKDDVTVANLEVVFTTEKHQKDKVLNLVADPKDVDVLLHSGIDVLNTANNHSFDFGSDGYQESMDTLDQAGIAHFGTISPSSKNMADRLATIEAKGIKIGFVGFSYPQKMDEERIAQRVQALREEGCSLVIASLHWGRELNKTPSFWEFGFARKVLDAGADVVFGHHPHILQPVQFYKGKPIFYSLGNFTFGSMGQADPDTGIFQLRYRLTADGPALVNFTAIPCRTQGAGDFRPYELTDPAERQTMLKKLMYRKQVKNMLNLPESFLQTGSVDFVNGDMVP